MNNRVGFQGRLRQPVRVMVGSALAVVLAACGGSSGGSSQTQVPNSFIYASKVIGHGDYSTYKPNQVTASGSIGASAQTLSNPTGSIATDGTHFYIADTNNHRILGWSDGIPSAATGASAEFVIGQPDFTTTTPGTSQGSLSYPDKVSISDDGRLVVADTGNNRVLIWNSLPTSNVPPDLVIGQVDFNHGNPNQDSATPTANSLSNPTAAMIAKNRLFVIDNNNNRMLIWDLTKKPLTDAVNGVYADNADFAWGQPSTSTNVPNCGQGTIISGSNPAAYDCSLVNYPISQYSLNQPQDMWTDGTKLFVADSANNRVLFWSQIPIANSSFPTYVMGQGTFTSGSSGGTSQSGMNSPYGVASDGSRVFVADSSNNRVLVFNNFPASSAPNADTVLGQNYWNYKTANDDDQNQQQDNNPTGRTLNRPTAVFALGGSTEQLFVADFGNNRVLEFNPQ